MLATLADVSEDTKVIVVLLVIFVAALAFGIVILREKDPEVDQRDPWSSALTQPPETARPAAPTPTRVDGTFGSWVGRGFAVAIGLVAAWFFLLFTAPIGWIAVPFLLAWVWPRKRA